MTDAPALSERAVAWGYLAAWRAVGRLPESQALALFTRVADRLHARDGRGVQTLRANLSVVCPGRTSAEIDDLVHDATRSYLRYWAEAFRLPRWPLDDLVSRTVTLSEDRLRAPHAAGQGVIAVLPHQGNWDWAGAWACGTGMPLMTVAERLRPERLYDEFVRFREGLGMQILPLTGGEEPLGRMEEWLRRGGFVCLLADRHLGGASADVELCDRPVQLPVGAAVLARRTGAPLVPTTTAYDGSRLRITFHEPVPVDRDDLTSAMQGVADAFTSALRAAPQDWHMMQRVFRDLAPLPRGGA